MNRPVMIVGGMALAAALVACDVDFTEPEPSPPLHSTSPARLFTNIHVGTHQATQLRLHAGFTPGVNTDGAIREVPDDTLWLGGTALPPERVDPGGQRTYRWLPDPEVIPDSLRLDPPAVAGTVEPPPMEFRAFGRAGEDSLTIVPGDTLRLTLEMLGSASDLLQSSSWTLHVSGPGGTLTYGTEDTAPPLVLPVPAAWLEWSRGEEMQATLVVREISTYGASDGDYQLHLSVTSTVEWTLNWR